MEIYMCVFAVCVTAIIIAYMLITQNSNENSNANLTFEKDEPQIYGNEYNCIMTMFGECSYAETGCGDCAVVEKVRKALEQTEPMKTTDYCDICKRDMCEDCIADATNPYCVPSHYEINYEPKDEPQTERSKQWPIT